MIEIVLLIFKFTFSLSNEQYLNYSKMYDSLSKSKQTQHQQYSQTTTIFAFSKI
jgi:hypothetical protein